MEQTSQLQRFSVWLQLKDKPHSPSFQILFKCAACNFLAHHPPLLLALETAMHCVPAAVPGFSKHLALPYATCGLRFPLRPITGYCGSEDVLLLQASH